MGDLPRESDPRVLRLVTVIIITCFHRSIEEEHYQLLCLSTAVSSWGTEALRSVNPPTSATPRYDSASFSRYTATLRLALRLSRHRAQSHRAAARSHPSRVNLSLSLSSSVLPQLNFTTAVDHLPSLHTWPFRSPHRYTLPCIICLPSFESGDSRAFELCDRFFAKATSSPHPGALGADLSVTSPTSWRAGHPPTTGARLVILRMLLQSIAGTRLLYPIITIAVMMVPRAGPMILAAASNELIGPHEHLSIRE